MYGWNYQKQTFRKSGSLRQETNQKHAALILMMLKVI
jgi:hypothetical protein